MRNTTKLKAILRNYTVDLAMNDEINITMTIFDKQLEDSKTFENSSYSVLISKAYSYANKKRRKFNNEDED